MALKTYEPALDYTLAQKTDVSNITDGITFGDITALLCPDFHHCAGWP